MLIFQRTIEAVFLNSLFKGKMIAIFDPSGHLVENDPIVI